MPLRPAGPVVLRCLAWAFFALIAPSPVTDPCSAVESDETPLVRAASSIGDLIERYPPARPVRKPDRAERCRIRVTGAVPESRASRPGTAVISTRGIGKCLSNSSF